MAFTIVLDRFLNESAIEYAASLDQDLKTQLQPLFEQLLEQDKKQELLEQVLSSISGFSKLNDKVFEQTCNLLLHLFDILASELELKLEDLLSQALYTLTQIQTTSDDLFNKDTSVRSSSVISVLSNFFNYLSQESHLRVEILQNILSIISRDNLKNVTYPLSKNLSVWLKNAGASDDEFKSIYIQAIEALYTENQDEALSLFNYLLTEKSLLLQDKDYQNFFVKSLNASTYKDLSSLNLEALKSNQALFELSTIYKNLDLQSYLSFIKSNNLSSYQISTDKLTSKLQTSSITKLAVNKAELSYEEVSSELSIPVDDVELFLLNCIKQKLISGRLNQAKQVLYLQKVTKLNSLTREEWSSIGENLNSWSTKIAELKTFVETLQAKKGKRVSPPQVLQIFHQQKQELKEQMQQEKDKEQEATTNAPATTTV